ncbi:MAG: asparagine synthase (glutamine-hydrolyzing) [Candidatus Marinimicrobia bacterium]|nr:asparagine synthase (glutamine-hydrolyzing) [Candidatus Neomarinimicrobiota bacterium]
MCGIAGGTNLSENQIKNIKQSMIHRGPDEQNIASFGDFSMIHTRLSIQDVTNGSQPFQIEDYVIAFNGEIYNHLSLRKRVKNHTFKTRCDTETLLALFIENGISILDEIDGMFAFSILNKLTNEVFLGRDRAGKKPLYIYKNSTSFIFASELNAIKIGVEDLSIDDDAISSYLRNGFFFKDKTPYKNVLEIEPGNVYTLNLKDTSMSITRYFDQLQYYKKEKINDLDTALKEVDLLLHRSIKNRLFSSDLEVGAFLSGGIDSSLVVAIGSEYVDKLKTFTVKFDGAYDESSLAMLTAEKYNTDHTEIPISINLQNDIEDILLNYGEPFMDSSCIPSYYVSREAKKYVTVVLNGDGADELFGGYRRYVPIGNKILKSISYFSFFNNFLPPPRNKKTLYNYIYRLMILSNKSGIDYYTCSTNNLFEGIYEFKNNDTFAEMDSFIRKIENEKITDLSKVMFMDFNMILPSDLLKKMDIATMANSVEGRSPFLSKYMLEFAPTLSDKLKINGTKTKFILRELSKKYLHRKLIKQPKRGFEVPLKHWVDYELRENIFDVLNQRSFSSQFVDWDFIDKLLHRRINVSDEKRAQVLWTLYCLDVWNRNQ